MKRSLAGRVRRAPLRWYFAGAFGLSALALTVIGPPKFHAGSRPAGALAMFPLMVVGVGALGVALTAATAGRVGLHSLRSRLRFPATRAWLLVLVIPPAAIIGTLEALRVLASSNYTPQLFVFGIPAGLLAGGFEELGWTGFAYPRIRLRLSWFPSALLLGVLWGVWHLPVVDALGAASPHRTAWPAFFAAFITMIVTLRVLIAWVYENTGSILVAQGLHASSSGSLVIFGAPHVTAAQEATWYFAYACVLGAVAVIAVRYTKSAHRPLSPIPDGPDPVPAGLGVAR